MRPVAATVLKATGYLARDGTPSDGLVTRESEHVSVGDASRLQFVLTAHGSGLRADAVFRVGTTPVIVFKSSENTTDDEHEWHRAAWNSGLAPLLWVTTPQYVRIYNAFQPPERYEKRSPLLVEFPLGSILTDVLTAIDQACGRRRMVTGHFWASPLARTIDRRRKIDSVLLDELTALLNRLVRTGLAPSLAQKLVGRCIFFQYLVHRGYMSEVEMTHEFGASSLDAILHDTEHTYALFRWIRATFNGDLFPLESEQSERQQLGDGVGGLQPLADFFGHFNVSDGQGRLFPFRFESIPVELISSIYEKFVRLAPSDGAPLRGVHYTPTNLVDLTLDPVFEGLSPTARILDPACGSGVFLVESLRRLVWLRSRTAPLTRDLIRTTLLDQLRGIDISPAALSVAAFSLYLAVLELDPQPPRGIDALSDLRFGPLQEQVLFAGSTFDPGIADRLAARVPDLRRSFDAIVGNPPWTYSPDEKRHDRRLLRESRGGDAETERARLSPETLPDFEQTSGTTYARLANLPIPPRSTDWAFLWRSRDFCHDDSRIALLMKATPFFSLDARTSSARAALLGSFPNVTLVNLSQLRTERLFHECEDGTDNRSVKTAGPALVFFSNCLPTQANSFSALNFPWSSTFRLTGVFDLPAEPPRSVALDTLKGTPVLFKAAFFGTERDLWFVERLSRSDSLVSLSDWWRGLELPVGQGYQRGERMESDHLLGLPQVTPRDLRSGRVSKQLSEFSAERVHRKRDPRIFQGPLVLLPEGALTNAPIPGRYTAAYDPRDLAYSESFFGVSFQGESETLGRAFAGVMYSALVAYQLAMTGGTVGIKQTKIEAVDLESVRIPRIHLLETSQLNALARAADAVALGLDGASVRAALITIDAIVDEAADLDGADRELISDVERRARAILFETEVARRQMEVPPDHGELVRYALNLCDTFNAFATSDDDIALTADVYATMQDGLIAMRFTLGRHNITKPGAVREANIAELGPGPFEALGGTELPYLKASKAIRLYVDDAVYVVKPARYRYFSPAAGQTDGDRIVGDVMQASRPVPPN